MKTLDYERVDWFNKFLLHMWPFLDKVEIKRTIPLNKGVFFPLPTTSISFFSLVSTSIIASLLNSDNVFYFSSFLFFKCNTIFYVQEYICNMSSLRIRETEKALEKIERK
ncbi:hypothetical protein RIF29_30006 [Crotalaria pallida]|uniref:Uncharacterized protein n=1 Tax=Crotalaria pallida TaxID=3830 RepID=A0AAN9HWD5_CROPI